MRSSATFLALTALVASAASCHFDDLVDPPPTGVLVASPATVSVSAAAGPGSPRPVALALSSAASSAVHWTVERTGSGSWLALAENAGSTPDTLHLTISATGLAAGTYTDTLLLVPDDPDQATTRVPVTLTVAAGAERLAFRQAPTTTMAGATITPAVTVAGVDRDGAVITTFTGTVTLTLAGGPGGATLSGDVSASAVNGVATFAGLSLDKAGAGYALVATAAGMADETSPAFAITPGAATRLGFTQQPSSTTPNATITPAVTVTAYDGYGNVVTGFTGAVTIALGRDGSVLGNATLGGTLSVNAAAGVARFDDLTIDQLGGGYTLVAASSGLTSATSAGFDITPLAGSATEQRFSQQPSGAQAGSTMSPPVEVTILDGLGAPVTSFPDPVTLRLSGGTAGALLGGTTTAIPSNGVARFSNLTVDRAGTGYRLVASAGSLPDVTSNGFTVTAAPPPTGAIAVAAHTTGSDLDPDGYAVTVNGVTRTLASTGSTTFTGVPVGDQVVNLAGVAANCTVSGDDPRTVTAIGNDTVATTFEIACTAVPPPTGGLTVVTSSTGADLDPDGYTVSVDGDDRALAPNASTTYTGLLTGAHTVTLAGIASNCAVQGGNPRSVTVTAGNTASTTFNVSCTAVPPPTGALTVTSATTGTDLDPDGYVVTVNGDPLGLAPNASITFTGIPTGALSVTLSGVAANCVVQGGNPRTVTITAGNTTSTTFDVSCSATPPPTGAITVTTHTTGSDLDPDGYTVTVGGVARSLPLQGSTTYTGLPAGAVTVTLSGLAANCSIWGENPRSVTIVSGSTVSTTFDVGCTSVTPPPTATQLRFIVQPPSVAIVGGNFVVTVAGLDVNGNLVQNFTGRVNLVLSGALPTTVLAGTTGLNAVNGVATFNDLHLTGPCIGCRIQAGAAGLVAATSDPFTIVAP